VTYYKPDDELITSFLTTDTIIDDRLVIFFDIDNTLYSSSLGILSAILVNAHGKSATILGIEF